MRGFRTRETKIGTLAIWKQPSHVHWVCRRMTVQSVDSRLRITTFHARLRPNQAHLEQFLNRREEGSLHIRRYMHSLPALLNDIGDRYAHYHPDFARRTGGVAG